MILNPSRWWVALFFLAFAAGLDRFSGPDIVSVPFYLAPILIVAPAGAASAAIAAFLAGVLWFTVDVFSRPEATYPFLPLANAGIVLAFFLWTARLASGPAGWPRLRGRWLAPGGALLVALALTAFSRPLAKQPNRPGLEYWHGDHSAKRIAFTFDDGPNEPYTTEILTALKDNDVHATFFLLGRNALAFPAVARRIAEDGHAIGNHSFSHPDLIFEANGKVRDQILAAQDAIAVTAGVRPGIFRPPFGANDPLTLREAKQMGLVAVKWSVSSRDWESPGVDKIVANVLKGLENGGIVLFHDGNQCAGGNREQTVEAVRRLVPILKARGYEFVTVPELLHLQSSEAGAATHGPTGRV